MTGDLAFFALFLAGLTLIGLSLGPYMAGVFSGRIGFLAPVERGLLRLAGVRGDGQRWTAYAAGCCCSTRRGSWRCIWFCGFRAGCRSTRRALARWPRIRRSTPLSAS